MKKFEVGKRYVLPVSNRTQIPVTVLNRTEQYVVMRSGNSLGSVKRKIEVRRNSDGEMCECATECGRFVTADWEV